MKFGTRQELLAAARLLRPGLPAAGPSFEEDFVAAIDRILREGAGGCVEVGAPRYVDRSDSSDPALCGLFGVELSARFSAAALTRKTLDRLGLRDAGELSLPDLAAFHALQEQVLADLAGRQQEPGALLSQLRDDPDLTRAILAAGGLPSGLRVLGAFTSFRSEDPGRFTISLQVAALRS